MIGAIIGDIVGSRFEFNNTFDPYFELFHRDCSFTDDTICTVAIADALVRDSDFGETLREWCLCYPNPMGGYGGSFNAWLHAINPMPYNSFGNGAAMRVSPVGWAFRSEACTLRAALASAAPTHNHVEGLIGASTVARAIFNFREFGNAPDSFDVFGLVAENYGYEWNWKTHLPAVGVFDETCQGCVPLAFHILMQSTGFEDAIRQAVSWGGDSDTLAAIVGSLAEARWGIPEELVVEAMKFLPPKMKNVVTKFREKYVE